MQHAYKNTLTIIEEQIKNLEHAFMVVGHSNALITELGTAYITKMKLINTLQNGTDTYHTCLNKKIYPSKVDTKAATLKNAAANGSYTPQLDLPPLRKCNI